MSRFSPSLIGKKRIRSSKKSVNFFCKVIVQKVRSACSSVGWQWMVNVPS